MSRTDPTDWPYKIAMAVSLTVGSLAGVIIAYAIIKAVHA